MGQQTKLHRGYGVRRENRDRIDEPRTIEVDGVYDIETEAWTRFVVGGLLTRNGFHSASFRREDDFVDLLLTLSGRFFAHNGGRYDALWFLGHVRRRGLKATCYGQGQRITNLRVGDLILCDSYALVPMALKQGAQIGRIQKSDTGLPCVCSESCGGYCSISRSMPPNLMRRLIEYLEIDCRATLSMLDTLIDYAASKNLDLQYTIGGSSWHTAKRWIGLEKADWSWGARGQSAATLYSFARSAYYGGRTQVFRPSATAGYRYDVNSAYPAALASLSLPWGIPREISNREARRAYDDGREGLFRARVRVPECHVPPLPVRGALRLYYPIGTVDGTWTGNELRYAEEVGASVERIDSACVWHSNKVVFADLCRHVWNLRYEVGPKTALGSWLKWFANSLTGRLAIKPEAETIYIEREPNGATFCPADWDCKGGRLHNHSKRRCCEHHCTRRCGVMIPLGRNGQFNGVWTRKRFQIADSAHVHFAAYLTAHARIELHKQLTDYGSDDGWSAVYCDTDSCYSLTPRLTRVGTGLGEWKEEGTFTDFVALAPKTYAYRDEEGELEARSKGVEEASRNWETLLAGGGVEMSRGVKSLRSALRDDDDFFTRKHLTRRVLGTEDINGVRWFGDRFLADDGYTHPRSMQDGGSF